MEETSKNNANETEKEFIKRELLKTQMIIKEPWIGEISPEALERIYHISEDALKIATKVKEEKKTFNYTPSTQTNM